MMYTYPGTSLAILVLSVNIHQSCLLYNEILDKMLLFSDLLLTNRTMDYPIS